MGSARGSRRYGKPSQRPSSSLLITAAKNISPAGIEGAVLAASPLIAHVVAAGGGTQKVRPLQALIHCLDLLDLAEPPVPASNQVAQDATSMASRRSSVPMARARSHAWIRWSASSCSAYSRPGKSPNER